MQHIIHVSKFSRTFVQAPPQDLCPSPAAGLLSKPRRRMGNIASAASAVCIVGATAVIIAKPACDFVKRRLEAVEADVKRAIKLIEKTNKSLEEVKKTIDELPDSDSDTVLRAIDNIVKTNETLPDRMSRMEEVMFKTADGVVKTNEMLPNRMSKVEEMMSETVSGIVKANEAVDALPGTIDATAKKYSMYLHDEHVNMFELMSGLCPSPAISPRSYASEGANRIPAHSLNRKDFLKNLNPSRNKNGKENF